MFPVLLLAMAFCRGLSELLKFQVAAFFVPGGRGPLEALVVRTKLFIMLDRWVHIRVDWLIESGG